MNVVSLFDGMSCGLIALERAGIPVDTYFSSEIDKYAISISNKNYPDIVRCGDITKINGSNFKNIDLLMGGSPCQGFSFAGKQLNFNDERSKLFFEFIRILNECKPTYFLLENVVMKKEYQDIISSHLGVEPIKINSALVSAQNRNRLYWTNIPNVTLPKDKGLMLYDILEKEVDAKYALSEKIIKGFGNGSKAFRERYSPHYPDRPKSYCLTARYFKSGRSDPYVMFLRGRGNNPGGIRAIDGKVTTLTSSSWEQNNFLLTDCGARRLTPIECERLQTVPDNYTEGVSNTQRYKMLGNGWTVDVIAHILKGIK